MPACQSPTSIVAVVDATNLERNLYLVTQLFEFGVPVVVALTMIDVFEKQKHEIDIRNALRAAQNAGRRRQCENAAAGRSELAEKVERSSSARRPTMPYEFHADDPKSGPHGKIFARYNFISSVVQESVWHSDHRSTRFRKRSTGF